MDPQSEMRETRVAALTGGLARLEGYQGSYFEKLKRLSGDTAGLTLLAIEDLLQQASSTPGQSLNHKTVMAMKRRRLSQESEGLLEVLDTSISLKDIGGYAEVKRRLKDTISDLAGPKDALSRASLPMGLLFLGPPGTGKTIMAAAIAGESNVSMAKLGDFRGMYVGQSERNLSRIFSLIEALHPVIVFIDEIDQALGSRGAASGDGGVDNRVFGKFLEFMSNSDHRGKILWVGASNHAKQIDPAFKRAGRFDLIIPFMLPDAESRADILRILLEKAAHSANSLEAKLEPQDFCELAAKTENFSGAELEAIVNESLRRARIAQRGRDSIEIQKRDFESVLAVYHPPAGQRERYIEMEQEAAAEISFIDLLPEKCRAPRQSGEEEGGLGESMGGWRPIP